MIGIPRVQPVVDSDAPHADVAVRPAGDDDRAFLFRVYASGRRDELRPLGWDDAAARSFLQAQFDHEERDWHLHHSGAECMVVTRGGSDVGRLCVARSEHEIRIMDISVLPEHRGQGIAGTLLASLLDEARHTRRTVRLTVERGGAMVAVCRRLGFLPAATRGGTLLMEWTAEVTG